VGPAQNQDIGLVRSARFVILYTRDRLTFREIADRLTFRRIADRLNCDVKNAHQAWTRGVEPLRRRPEEPPFREGSRRQRLSTCPSASARAADHQERAGHGRRDSVRS
jgi:hypothetical protein